MSDKKSILFISNPISGYKKKEDLRQTIRDNLDHQRFEYEFVNTEYKGHATELSSDAVDKGIDIIIAVGGDGTLNEVAKPIVNSKSVLGVVPNGSGNGFAMHIGMGRNCTKAIKKLNKAYIKKIDTCTVNGRFFLNLAGIGFDALVAHKVENAKNRGFQMYINTISKELIKFKAETYSVKTENETINGPFSVIAVANAAMYGYNFTIAPLAQLTDGLLDVVLIKKAPILRTMGASWRLLNNSLDKSPLVDIKKAKEVIISLDKPYYYHIDGESGTFESELHFKIHPASLNMLFPPDNPKQN